MLTLSADAAQAVKQVVNSSEAGENGGIRLTLKPVDDQQAQLQLSLATNPEPGDTQVEHEGANVFMDEKVAPFLDDKVLDATIEDEGPSFTILDKSGEASG